MPSSASTQPEKEIITLSEERKRTGKGKPERECVFMNRLSQCRRGRTCKHTHSHTHAEEREKKGEREN